MERQQMTRIKGISERRRLPRLGKVRLGIKVKTQTGKEYPKEVAWFVCPPEVRAIYGERPLELDIMFPVEDELACFPQAYKWYGATQGLRCKGNGEIALRRWVDCTEEQKARTDIGDKEGLVEVDCPCEKLGKECGSSGNLMVLLPKVSIGGCYQIDTGSVTNIITINSFINYLREITTTPRNPQGRIALIPLILRRISQEMTYVDVGVTYKSTHYLLQMDIPFKIDDIERIRRDSIAIPGIQYQLPAPIEDGKDYPEVVIDEAELETITPPEDKQPSKPAPEIKDEKTPELPQVLNNEVKKEQEGDKHIPTKKEIEGMLLDWADGDVEKAKAQLKKITTFKGRDGEIVKGIDNLNIIKDTNQRYINVLYGKVKNLLRVKFEEEEDQLIRSVKEVVGPTNLLLDEEEDNI